MIVRHQVLLLFLAQRRMAKKPETICQSESRSLQTAYRVNFFFPLDAYFCRYGSFSEKVFAGENTRAGLSDWPAE